MYLGILVWCDVFCEGKRPVDGSVVLFFFLRRVECFKKICKTFDQFHPDLVQLLRLCFLFLFVELLMTMQQRTQSSINSGTKYRTFHVLQDQQLFKATVSQLNLELPRRSILEVFWKTSVFNGDCFFWGNSSLHDRMHACIGGGGFKDVSCFWPKIWGMIQFDEHVFSIGWFNHHHQLS